MLEGCRDMKIKPDFLLRKVAENYVVVPVGTAMVDFNGMINLNETGAFLWEKLEHGASEEELLSEMLEAYDVDEQTAKAGVQNFIRELKEAGLLE